MTTSTATATSSGRSRWLGAAGHGLVVLVGLAFIAAGTTKLLGVPRQVEGFTSWGYPLWFMYVTGLVEVIGGAALIWPRTRLYGAIIMTITMVCAVLTHAVVEGTPANGIPAFVFLVICGTTAIRQWRARH